MLPILHLYLLSISAQVMCLTIVPDILTRSSNNYGYGLIPKAYSFQSILMSANILDFSRYLSAELIASKAINIHLGVL